MTLHYQNNHLFPNWGSKPRGEKNEIVLVVGVCRIFVSKLAKPRGKNGIVPVIGVHRVEF